jgi:CBS domain-containing protein
MRHWTVGDVMTRQVVAVPADAGYRHIVDLLAQHQVSALPVIDEAGRVLGVISEADVLHKVEAAGEREPPRLFSWRRRDATAKAHADTARELMSAITVGPDESVVAAAKLIDAQRVKRLPVVDGDRLLIGIVSRRDLMKIYLRDDADIRNDIVEEVLRRSLWLDPAAVRVDVDGGVVELRGRVDRWTTAQFLVQLTEAVPGVVRVIDRVCWDQDDLSATPAEPA